MLLLSSSNFYSNNNNNNNININKNSDNFDSNISYSIDKYKNLLMIIQKFTIITQKITIILIQFFP